MNGWLGLFSKDFHLARNAKLLLAHQRLALPAAGGTRRAPEMDKTQSHEKSHFDGENPAVRVHPCKKAGLHFSSNEQSCSLERRVGRRICKGIYGL